jgi:hypothetical protein
MISARSINIGKMVDAFIISETKTENFLHCSLVKTIAFFAQL